MNILEGISKHLLAVWGSKEGIPGIEISDNALRSALWDGSAWQLATVRLLPGTIAGGVIKNKPRLLSSLDELHTMLVGKSKKRIAAIFSLSSAHMYSTIFSVPLVKSGSFEKTVQYNVEMNAPASMDELYAGWEVVGKDDAMRRVDILSAFTPRRLIDGMSNACAEAGFVIAAVESKALALSRFVSWSASGFDPEKPAIVIVIDASGLHVSIIRNGHLSFAHTNQWRDIEDKKGNVSLADFSEAMLWNIRQMVNFYGQHWSEKIHDIYIISSVFRKGIAHVIKGGFPALACQFLEFKDMPSLDPQWFVAIGSGIRGSFSPHANRYLNFMEPEHL